MKSIETPPVATKRSGVQIGLILLASVALGLTYNVLNPAGLSFSAPIRNDLPEQAETSPGPYQVETLYAVPATSSNLPTVPSQPATQTTAPSPAKTRTMVSASRTTWEKAQPLVQSGEVVLVDSRPRLSYEAGHIPKAVSLPENELASKIASFYKAYPPATSRLVIYCSSSNCGSSSKLAALLTEKYGYQDVRYVPGGYLDWVKNQKSASK